MCAINPKHEKHLTLSVYMKKTLLTGIAALFLATGAAHADSEK